jgi:hypothetical protein
VFARLAFLMVNCTVPSDLPALPGSESDVIGRSIVRVLQLGNLVGNYSVLVSSNPSGNAANFTVDFRARRLRSVEQREVWNVSAVVTLLEGRNNRTTSASLEKSLNESVVTGLLQAEVHRLSLALPPVPTLTYAVLCGSMSDTNCLQMVPVIPAVSMNSATCARSSNVWTVLYDAPQVLPWYLLWLGVQGIAWILVGMRAVLAVTSVTRKYALLRLLVAAFATVHAGYILLLMWSRWWYPHSDAYPSYACTEFAYLDDGLTDVPHLLLLARGLIYPAMGALASGE